MAAAAKACNLDPEKALNSVLIGTDGKANVVAVLTGEGLGDEKNLTACKGGANAAGGKLIPEQATIMVGVDVSGLMKTKLYGDNKAEFEKQKEYSEMAAAAKACNLDPEKALNSVLIGTDGKANVVAVLTGEGLGDEKNLACIADKAKEKNGGKTPFTIVDEGGKKTLKMESGEGTGYIVDGKTVVFASKAWEGAVKDLIDGKGKPATDGPNKDLFARADQSKHIWAAGLVPAEMAGGAKSVGADAKDFSVSFDLSDGLALKAAVGLASADQAKELKKKGDDNLPGAKMMAGMMGVPPKALETLKIDTKDNQITVEGTTVLFAT
jgi:prolyl-tRNA editing enzyme YbaK/EbsC (Cys-tRNA(Pro) deacylase)